MPTSTVSRCLSSRALAFALGFAVSLAAVIPFSSAKAQSPTPELIVKYDQSQLLRLPRPVAEIIIGNPTIADVTVQHNNMLVITGKTFGITNVIALDAERNIIQDQRIMVIREEARVVNVQKGAKRETYNCAPMCNPSLVAGDDQAYFEGVGRMFERKIKFTEGSADNGTGNTGNQ